MSKEKKLTHVNQRGEAHMVDVGGKAISKRIAKARGEIIMLSQTLEMILNGNAKKGDVIASARIAGIMAAKKTPELIPLCHPIALTKVNIDIEPDSNLPGFVITATTQVEGQTGVEMEALTACTIACLTIYDMAKAVDRGMQITAIQLLEKSGGKSGHWKIGESNASLGT